MKFLASLGILFLCVHVCPAQHREYEYYLDNPEDLGSESANLMILPVEGEWFYKSTAWKESEPTDFRTIYASLQEHHRIADPLRNNNLQSLGWVAQTGWEYTCRFYYETVVQNAIPLNTFGTHRTFELEIDQVYGTADVFLNGQWLFTANNAFRTWKTDITAMLRKDTSANELVFRFHEPMKEAEELEIKNGYRLPGGRRVFMRQPAFQYGWDFSPACIQTGLWGKINLVAKRKNWLRVHDTRVFTQKITSGSAGLKSVLTVESSADTTTYLYMHVSGNKETGRKVLLKKGMNRVEFTSTLRNPQLWFPGNEAKPQVYHLRYNFYYRKPSRKKIIFSEAGWYMPYGICRIELVQEKDEAGAGFYFRVNGKKIFARGVNMVLTPQKRFPEHALDKAVQMHANMVRVWGGGVYPDRSFYNYCLVNGIMVWQDLMFANAMYPGDTGFISNVAAEVQEQIRKIGGYNNLALVCGNNECREGWENWDWKKEGGYVAGQVEIIEKNYRDLFEVNIPRWCRATDTALNYIPTSPAIGWGHAESMQSGDAHYWGVWWGKEPVEVFRQKVPRFMSEFGMQAIPHPGIFKEYLPDTALRFNSPLFAFRQQHPTGFATLDHYLKEYICRPDHGDLYKYAYATQVLQSFTLTTALNAQRNSAGRCMGSLVWQMNDAWPGISWSLLDYQNQPKIAWHELSAHFNPLAVHVLETDTGYAVFVNTDMNAVSDTVRIRIMDFYGKRIHTQVKVLKNYRDTGKPVMIIPRDVVNKEQMRTTVMVAELMNHHRESVFHFVKPNELKLPVPEYTVSVTPLRQTCNDACTYEITLDMKTYMPYTALFNPQSFSRGREGFYYYGHLLPEKKTFYVSEEEMKYYLFLKDKTGILTLQMLER